MTGGLLVQERGSFVRNFPERGSRVWSVYFEGTGVKSLTGSISVRQKGGPAQTPPPRNLPTRIPPAITLQRTPSNRLACSISKYFQSLYRPLSTGELEELHARSKGYSTSVPLSTGELEDSIPESLGGVGGRRGTAARHVPACPLGGGREDGGGGCVCVCEK